MTLQVCMVAPDGYLMASDTKVLHLESGYYSSHETKIFFNTGRAISWCGAGDDVVRIAGCLLEQELVTRNIDFDEMRSVLRRIGEQAWHRKYGDVSAYSSRPLDAINSAALSSRKLTVAKNDGNTSRIWVLEIFGVGAVDCREMIDKSLAGNDLNPVTFFLERFYGSETRALVDLKILAAATILLGGTINPTGVGGLEMLTCSKGNMEMVSLQEIADLKMRVDSLDAAIASLLFQ